MGNEGRVVARNKDGTPFITIKNEHLIKKRRLFNWSNIIKFFLISIPWLIFTVIWNYIWVDATPFEDVFAATCLYFFNRSFVGRFRND